MISNQFSGLDFDLGETADMLRDAVSGFASKEIAPRAAAIDESNEFPKDLWIKMGGLGLLGITADEAYGGAGMGYLEHVVAMEEISRASASVGLSYGAHSQLAVNQIQLNGTDDQKARYLPKLISGDHVGALAMSEAGAGSDVVGMKLRADRKGDRYILNGSKMWITNGPDADTLVVYAKTDMQAGGRGISAFIVERGFDGVSTGPHMEKLGMGASEMSEIFFEDCIVPEENLLGPEDTGFLAAMKVLTLGRIASAATAIGLSQAALQQLDEAASKGAPSMSATAARVAILKAENRHDEAKALLDSAVEKEKSFETYFLRGMYRASVKDLAGAEQDYRHLITFQRAGQGYDLLGRFFLETSRVDEAISAWKEGLEKHPENQAIMRNLMKMLLAKGLLHGDCLTATGKTVRENLDNVGPYPKDQDVVYPFDKPLKPDSYLRILYGNLAPTGAVAKISGKEGLSFTGRAITFDSEEAAREAILDGAVQ
ncbi:MAG: acyl-CoA dehydrogenase family protein, partial [Proteobacteria bacterium]|nr:acyl-CoA dehydrogenase family protein [Pseudomonadota bacterium]